MSFRTACIFVLLATANAQVLTERDAINAFLTGSPQATELQAGIEAVTAETRAWTLWANPDVSYSREGASVNHIWQVEQRLPLNGRLGYLRQAGGAAVAAVRSQSAFQRWEGVSAVRAAFYEVLAAQDREKVIRSNLDGLSEIVRVLTEREKLGEGSTYDRLRVEREMAEIHSELSNSRATTELARSRLAALLRPDTEPSSLVVSGELRTAADVPHITDLRRRALEIRGDYRAHEAAIGQYQFSQRAAQRLRFPEPSVLAGFNRSQVGVGTASGSYIALSVPLPLFNDGRNEVARLRAEAERAQARRQTLEQRIFAELTGAHAAFQIRRTAAEEYRRSLDTQGLRLDQIAQVAYQEGEIGVLSLLDAWRVSLQSRLRLLELEAASKQAEIELERVAGEPVLNKGVLP